MAWDDELERLATFVYDNLGEEAMQAAINRAFVMIWRTPGVENPWGERPSIP